MSLLAGKPGKLERKRERERERESERDRQTDRQSDKGRERERERNNISTIDYIQVYTKKKTVRKRAL